MTIQRAGSTTGEGDSSNESEGSKNGYKNNYGFGAKFEMTFKLSEDGKMAATHDDQGNKLASNVTPTKVNTRFEFNGDDDLWVFIDGNLVLDMGGAHGASYGYIDFATKTAFAETAVRYGVGGEDYLGLDGSSGITELTGTAFTDKIAESTTGDNGGYNPDKLHTMTIFYMERGMAESNLFIRFNFPAESNYNKLKVKEQTDFSGVNAGLRDATKIAADTDVFKYKIENNGTDADAVLQMNTPYPTQENYVRQITAAQTNKTKLASSTSTTPGSNYFDVANITADADGYKPVKNTNYNWVDEYALNSAGEKMDSGKLVSGKTDDSGYMYLMYGTMASENTDGKERKSSGEFEGQFTRYSKMKVTQQLDLRTPDSHSVGTNDAAASLTSQTSPARTFDDYYTLSQSYIFSTTNKTPVNINNGQEFSFRNEINTSAPATGDSTNNKDTGEHLKSKVIMTAQFVNTPKTADIEIKKVVTGSTDNTDFGFEIELSNVFGVSTASVTNHGAIVSSKNSGTANTSNISGTNKGTFTLQNGDTLKISGIPVHTKYKITETSGRGQTVTGEVTDGEIQTSDNGTTIKVTVTNKFQSETGVDVLKKNSNGDPLAGAEFELWYKETLTPPTYIFNEPELVPNQLNTMKVAATPSELGVPGFEIPSTIITTYKFTTSYTAPTLPTVTDTDWILPRNDTDYIYFRDYNVGDTGWEDKESFATQNGGSDGKRSWRETNFGHHTGHNQDQELFFGDNDTYWMAAEFSGYGKKTIRYAMWERFVDKYDKNSDNTEDVVTTVWKIQPPDGYTNVKFMMLVGDTVIRESKTIAYELGKIYHKSAWGKWTKRNGIDSYYDVPVVAEGYWAPNSTANGAITDSRMSYTTYDHHMLQARKYEPTAQKVIFHCNSTNVWHNIHIEFFEDSAGANPVNGQAFPGYMMEPYAYAGSDYRMSDGYLTYELTIPATAKYFRINNGELTGAYSYKTAIMPLNDGSTTGKGKKNYGNYWCFGTYSNDNATLVQWTPQKEEKGATNKIPDKDYKNAEVTSDYDYIYFEKPTGWTNVYAYFYAGGNLRADNWQRACYSSWPGVAPAGTEYGTVHSNTYSIKTTDDTYNGTTTTGALSPETTISGGTIYKFRIPKGDRTNYSKVVFNNGLTAVSGGDETGVIEYQPGHIYTVKGKATKHYENSPTVLYEAKTITVNDNKVTEYLYVKNTAGWDDLHITFYDANGGQILQQGKGYVMDYAGDSGGNYFKIPIPEDAAKFSVNNGIGSANANKVSPQADIVRLDQYGKPKTNPATTDKFAYELTETSGVVKLTRSTITTQKVVDKNGQATPQEEGFKDYTMIDNPATSGNNKADPENIPQVRQTTKNGITTDDTLNIRDMVGWDANIGEISVTFYTNDNKTIGPNVMMKTVADAQGKKWYTKKIHPNATSFTITYMDKNDSTKIYTTPKYPIYPSVSSDDATDGQEHTESGCMFFDTKDSGVDSKLVMTNVEPAKIGNEVDDETYPKRGDFLYIVRTDEATAPHITFYASGTNVIKSGVKAKYINTEGTTPNTKYWFKVSIPEGAQLFVIDGVVGMTAQPIYELKAKASVYQKDYTLGDMQYKFNGTTATCVYPVFTETPVDTLTISNGHTLTSKVAVLVDEDAIASYNGTATLPETTGGSAPSKEILYNTVTADKDDVTYSWTDGGTPNPNYDYVRFVDKFEWAYANGDDYPVRAYFYGSTTGATPTYRVVDWDSYELDSNNKRVYKFPIPEGKNYKNVIFTNRIDSSGGWTGSTKLRKTNDITLVGNNTVGYGHGYLYEPNSSGDGVDVTILEPEPVNEGTVPLSDDKLYVINFNDNSSNGPTGDNMAMNVKFYDSSDNEVSTASKTGANGKKTKYGSTWYTDNYRTVNMYAYSIPSSYSYAVVYNVHDNSWSDKTVHISKADIEANVGKAIWGTSYTGSSPRVWRYEWIQMYNSSGTPYAAPEYPILEPVSDTTITYAYQPEDRYGMISDQNTTTGSEGVLGAADVNDFIKITLPDTVTKPYIKFYNGSTYINNATGATASTKGLLLNGSNMTLNSSSYTIPSTTGTGTKTYQVRLPKNATKFEILNDTDEYGGKQNIDATNVTATIGTSGQSVTLDSFRHAGTTFTYTVNGDNVTVSTSLRTGFTPYKTDTMTDPLKPMSDADFVFFTDTNGTFANSNKVYAYFYGAADGEYKAWPGIMADSANTTAAATSYINNNGDKVYKFRIPKDDDGNYTKVIFTDGQSSPKITAAQTIVGGTNYILGSANNSQDYGTMTAAGNVYDVTTESKTTSHTTAQYNSADNRTIYIIDNGTICNASGETHKTGGRYILDDMHIEFFGSDGVTHIGTPEGYIPEKAGIHADVTVYRITVPSNAMFFRVNNGNGKADVTTAHNHSRHSEIKQITDNGLYEFVTAEKYTKDGSDPQTVSALSTPEYLLTLINKIDLEGNNPTSETYDVHLATIRTGTDGQTSTILWVKDDLDNVDTNYLVDNSSIPIKVKKDGTYYWKEVTPPSGYTLSSTNIQEFTLPPSGEYTPAQFTNPDIDKGSLTLTKKLHSVDATNGNTAETTQLFTFTIELNAPVGSDWSDFVTDPIVTFTGAHAADASIVANSEVIDGTNRVFSIKLPADGVTTATLTNIPYGTTYNITETAPTNYSSTPVEIKYQNSTIVEEMKGTVNAETTSYLVTDKHEVGSLTLKDVVIDRGANALYYAGVNQPKNEGQATEYIDYTKYDYYVILEAPEGIDLKDYISLDDLDAIIDFKDTDVNKPSGNTYIEYTDRNGTTSTRSIGNTANRSKYKFHIDVTSSVDGAKTISNIPIGTQYSVVEIAPTATYNGTDNSPMATNYTGAGVSWYGTEGVPESDPGEITLDYESDKNNNSPTVTITNYYRHPSTSISVEKAIPEADTDHRNMDFSFVIDFNAGITAFNTANDPDISISASDLTYTYTHGTPATDDPSGASFDSTTNRITVTLKPGQKVKIDGIPANIAYTVTETTPSFWESKYTINGGSEQTGSVASDTTVSGTERAVKFTNTYVTPIDATLTLTKTLADGTNDSTPPTDFIYRVVLTAPAGMNLQTYNTDNGVITLNDGKYFVNDSGTQITTHADYGSYASDGSTYTFYVKVNAGDNGSVKINNIPCGTAYDVTEILTTDQTHAGWVKGVGTYGNTNETDHKHYIGSDNTKNTFNSTNAKTAELVLHEVLLNGITNHTNDKFTFTADLVAPDGIRFTTSDFTVTYVDGENVTHTISPESDDLTVTVFTVVEGTEVKGDTHARIAVKISNTLSAVTISGIPYGTEYTVEQTAMPDNTTYSKWVKVDDYYHAPPANGTPASADPHIINAPTQHFTAENAITGAVKIRKTVEATTGSTLPANATFNFTAGVSNVPAGLDLGNFTISTDLAGTNPLTVTNGSISVPVAVTSSNTSTTPAEVIIYGIPQGAEVSISEDAVPSASWENTSDNTSYTITIGDNLVSTTAEFKNTFTSQSITLFKQDAANSAGIRDAHFYLLKLKAGTDITSDTVKAAFASNNIDNVVPAYAEKVTTVGSNVILHAGESNQTTLESALTTSAEGFITVSEPGVDFTTGNRYFFYEADLTTASVGGVITTYYMDNTLSPSKIVTIDGTKTAYPVTYTNYRRGNSTDVELFKTNDSNDPLPGAEYDLYYKESTTPPNYSVNNPYYTPLPTSTDLVNGSKVIPTETQPTTYDTYTYSYEYKDTPVPSASDTEWIQPRTDNDYIYFRDYNDAANSNGKYIGSQDQRSFTVDNSGTNNTNSGAQNDKRSWIFTNFKDNEFGQDQEIDYDHSYWIMAVFSGHPTKKDYPEYSVWERFVDRVNLNGKEQDTVVWKIQPPDGYTKVRFLLYHDYWAYGQEYKTCIRSTEEITFKLGEIYHKTSYGEWKLKNHYECYFNAPCTSEGTWSTYKTAANSQTQVKDKRQTGDNTNYLYQADRYTPTQQKIIFHCNSKTVWHNIHIEFFTTKPNGRTPVVTEGTKTYYPIGQSAPGYLMEPYAYAGNDYRINGSLTYELTIPAEAEYFRVNNGVASGNTYYYCSKIKKLKHDTDRNNYGNYFSINGSSSKQDVIGHVPVTLGSWNDYTNYGDKWYESYTENDVDSDYDYIYFEKPSDWGNHVYAYFYAGNDLRDDNWQRATYTAWPGVAPVGTEYVEHNNTVTINADGQGTVDSTDTTVYHSDLYNYSYTGNLYADSGSGSLDKVSPETTINNGKVIYKFRIPKSEQKSYTNGEKRNYFNDGLYSQGGRNETRAIKDFKAGYLYYSNGSSKKHYDNKPTATYNKRGTGDDYIYIKTTDTTNWDDIHITFYNANGTQILQGGKGYVMDYAGKQTETKGGSTTTYSYFRAAIPTNAAKFSINNGKEDDNSRVTPKYDILRLSTTTEGTDKADYTKDHLVYELDSSAKTLTMTAPHFKKTENITNHTGESQSSGKDYTARQTTNGTDDMLYIRNTAGWTMGIGGAQVKFYDENGAQLGIAGTYTLIKSDTETVQQASDNGYTAPAEWYSIPIPENAASFTVTYDSGTKTTGRTAIYPYGNTNSRDGQYTTGNMYYETESGGTLSVISSTVTHPGAYTDPIYAPTHTRNGNGTDYLYLVCADKNDWQNMTVTFKDGTGTTIKFTDTNDNEYSSFPVQYLNEIKAAPAGETPISGETSDDPKAVGYWYKIAIPDGAKSFTVSRANGADTSSAVIYDLAAKTSVYKKDYTLGDMQYRLPDSGTAPTLLYPVFTEIEGISMEVGDNSVSGTGAVQADATAIAAYEGAAPATAPAPSYTANEPNIPYPVLYETHTNVSGTYSTGNTNSSNVTKTWTEGTPDYKIYFDANSTGWTNVNVHLWGGTYETSWPGVAMSDNDNDGIFEYTVPAGYQDSTSLKFNNGNGGVQSGNGSFNLGYEYSADGTSEYLYLYNDGWSSGDNNIYYRFDNGSTEGNGQKWDATGEGPTGSRKFKITGTPSTISFSVTGLTEVTFTISSEPNRGKGRIYKINSSGTITYYSYGAESGFTLNSEPKGGSSGLTTYTATYQIEDRYGYVNDLNGTYGNDGDDKDNYIYLNTTMPKPYVMFYTGTNGGGTQIGGVNGTTTVGIKADSVGTNLYRVRLPRAAKSFVVTNGAVANPATTNAYNLYQTGVQYTVGTGGDAQTYTLGGTYHHAGTKFDVTTAGVVTINTLRSGFTPNRETTLTDPLNPRSDSDYVFFTDTNGSFANSGTVYAYFYGGADGEFTKWPGTKASTPTGTNAATTYTDNYGRTVYMFRIPQDDEGTYPYVIFNNGTTNITQAQEVAGGKNYILDTNTDNDKTYGTFDASAQAATAKDRTTETSGILYSTSGTNRYIYIVNNGTQNLKVANDTPALDTGRFTLDDMHIVFYDENKRPIGVGGGTGYAGYKPDRLLNVTISGPHDVYRIQFPNGAKYFQINNGEREETGSTATQTQFNERQSELKAIAANGLYKFVEHETDPQKYIESTDTMPTGNDETRQAPHYLLTLVNEVETDEDIPETDTYYVKLATVVTKDSRNGTDPDFTGNIDYIKWLKLNDEGTQVDQNYLDHTISDIGEAAHKTAVNVVKKGTYYWIESVAPAGYEQNEDRQDFVVKSDGEVTPTVKVFTYNDNNELVQANPENTVTVIDTPLSGEVVLTKISKEKVGTTDIGSVLPGAKFKLIKIKADGTEDDSLRFSKNTSVTDTNEYSLSGSAAFNTENSWLETGTDGKLTIKGLLPGDYCLEEQEGATGYSHLNHHTGEKQRVYFSTGSNTVKKEITLADEMAPAYIKLYEHINEKRDEWGDPTFIFKIKQIQYYDWVDGENEGDPKEWKLTDSNTEKEILVALTVNDDVKYTAGLLSHDDPSYDYNEWFEESTGEAEYNGVFDILPDGRIRVEPGKYEITRIPVSRYEFVENTYTMDNVADKDKPQDYIDHRTTTEKLTVTIPEQRTAIIHYYDKVEYYDKFTQVDEKINKFYKLGNGENGTTAGENLTVKGIRVDNYSVDTDPEKIDRDILDTTNDKLTVDVERPTRFKAYWIMMDGSEKQITNSAELAKFEITYEYDNESGDDEHFGNQADESDNDFSYNTTSDVITVENYTARYKNGVYTLKATYDGKFSENFDIVFERAS